MNEKEMMQHIELLQESLDDAMEIMIKIETWEILDYDELFSEES